MQASKAVRKISLMSATCRHCDGPSLLICRSGRSRLGLHFQGHGHPLPQGWLSGVAEAGHHLVVGSDLLLGAARLSFRSAPTGGPVPGANWSSTWSPNRITEAKST